VADEHDTRRKRDGEVRIMAKAGVQRGSERVRLACKAMAAAAADLRLACHIDEMAGEAVEDAADALDAEAARVCDLAEELGELAEALAYGWGQREAGQADPPLEQ
jgi:hypothetical protein